MEQRVTNNLWSRTIRRPAGALAIAAALGWCLPGAAQPEAYPSRPIRLILPVPPGGSVDTMARITAEKLRQKWGQAIVVENRPGASNTIGIEAVITAAPDGYTLLFGPGSPITINKLLFPNRALDPETLEPVSRIATNPVVLVVHPKVPVKTLQEFVAYTKANPGKLNYASAGDGGVPHLTAEMFQRKAGVTLTKVPYRGVSLAMTDLLAGQVDLIFVDISTAIEHIRTGNLRVLGVAAAKRHHVLPDTPALTEMFPDLISETWFAMSAPPKTPAAIVNQLSAAIADVVKEPDVQKRLQDMGDIEAVGSTPAEMAAFMKGEKARWAVVISEGRIKGE
jgi:tripartite-type tricarboxylate transporter receptor subunit TctC